MAKPVRCAFGWRSTEEPDTGLFPCQGTPEYELVQKAKKARQDVPPLSQQRALGQEKGIQGRGGRPVPSLPSD